MGSPVIYFLQLVLRVSFEFSPNAINKWLKFFQVFLQESFELCLGYGSLFPTSMTALVLSLLHANASTKKKSCKKSPVGPGGPSGLKIIFALLTKVVVVYVWLSKVYIQHLSLKRLLTLCWRLSRSLVWLQISLHKLSKQFIGKKPSKSRRRNRSGNLSGN